MAKISVAKFLGKSEDEIEALDESATLALFTEKIKDTTSVAFSSGEGRAFKKVRTLLKNTVGVESDEDDSIEVIVDKVKEKIPSGSDKKEITDDDVKNHGVFINLKKDYDKTKSELDKELSEKKVKEAKEKLKSEFGDMLTTDFKTPKNKKALDTLNELFLDEMSKITEKNGKFLLNGSVLEDDLHNPLSKADVAKMIASKYFDEKSQNDDEEKVDNDSPEKTDNSKKTNPKSLAQKQMPK